jgi:hypothetical protein
MHNGGINNDCMPCSGESKSSGGARYSSWISGILLAVLPKCPFCFMAFSSTMLLCGEGTTMTTERLYQSTPTIVLSAVFCAASVIGILLVRRDIRTFYALLLALTGATMVMTSVLKGGGIGLYYAGTIIIFSGVWLNSSLVYFLRRLGILPSFNRVGEMVK